MRRLPLPRSWRVPAAILLGSIIIAAGVSVSSAPLISTLSVVSTLVLVGVTAWYVWLTRQTVLIQQEMLKQADESETSRRDAEEHRRERQALIEVWRSCQEYVYSIGFFEYVTRPLRSDVKGAEAVAAIEQACKSLRREGDEMEALARRILQASPDLPQGYVAGHVWKVGAELTRRSGIGTLLSLTWSRVVENAQAVDADPSIKDLSTEWTLYARPQIGGLEWDALASCSVYNDFADELSTFERAAYSALRPDLQSDGNGAKG